MLLTLFSIGLLMLFTLLYGCAKFQQEIMHCQPRIEFKLERILIPHQVIRKEASRDFNELKIHNKKKDKKSIIVFTSRTHIMWQNHYLQNIYHKVCIFITQLIHFFDINAVLCTLSYGSYVGEVMSFGSWGSISLFSPQAFSSLIAVGHWVKWNCKPRNFGYFSRYSISDTYSVFF